MARWRCCACPLTQTYSRRYRPATDHCAHIFLHHSHTQGQGDPPTLASAGCTRCGATGAARTSGAAAHTPTLAVHRAGRTHADGLASSSACLTCSSSSLISQVAAMVATMVPCHVCLTSNRPHQPTTPPARAPLPSPQPCRRGALAHGARAPGRCSSPFFAALTHTAAICPTMRSLLQARCVTVAASSHVHLPMCPSASHCTGCPSTTHWLIIYYWK